MSILGITPVHDGGKSGEAIGTIGTSAKGAQALPTLAGPGPQSNVDGATSTTVTRYPRKMVCTASGGGLKVNFGTSDVAAPTVLNGMLFPSGVPMVINRKPGWTHWDAISQDGSTTGLSFHITVLEWEKDTIV